MPSSSAARTHATAASSSTWDPWVIQFPYAISLTFRPLLPRCRYSMAPNPKRERDGVDIAVLPSRAATLGGHVVTPVRAVMRKRAMMRPAAKRSGRIRVLGRIRCTIDPRILPEARILPAKRQASRTGDLIDADGIGGNGDASQNRARTQDPRSCLPGELSGPGSGTFVSAGRASPRTASGPWWTGRAAARRLAGSGPV